MIFQQLESKIDKTQLQQGLKIDMAILQTPSNFSIPNQYLLQKASKNDLNFKIKYINDVIDIFTFKR